jgi:hypothetical protein
MALPQERRSVLPVCLPACRAAARSAGRGAHVQAVPGQPVGPVQELLPALLALRVARALVSLVPEACREGVCQAAPMAARGLGAVSLPVSCREPVQR